jgi:hypothetical protein
MGPLCLVRPDRATRRLLNEARLGSERLIDHLEAEIADDPSFDLSGRTLQALRGRGSGLSPSMGWQPVARCGL